MTQSPTFAALNENEMMPIAAQGAQATFKYLWRELSWEYRRIIPGLSFAAVKMSFKTETANPDAPEYEHMWVGDLQFDGKTVSGTLMNAPNHIESLSEGDTVSYHLDEISDWLYSMNATVYGGFTIQVLRAHMSALERQDHDGMWGLTFPEPPMVNIAPRFDDYTPNGSVKKKSLLKRMFGQKAPPKRHDVTVSMIAELSDLNLSEHAMSENSGPSFQKQLQDDPSIASFTDENGWTLIQREALAGNLTPLKALMEAGSDPYQKNVDGMSALDLARLMKWPRIIQAIENGTH